MNAHIPSDMHTLQIWRRRPGRAGHCRTANSGSNELRNSLIAADERKATCYVLRDLCRPHSGEPSPTSTTVSQLRVRVGHVLVVQLNAGRWCAPAHSMSMPPAAALGVPCADRGQSACQNVRAPALKPCKPLSVNGGGAEAQEQASTCGSMERGRGRRPVSPAVLAKRVERQNAILERRRGVEHPSRTRTCTTCVQRMARVSALGTYMQPTCNVDVCTYNLPCRSVGPSK